MWFFQKNGTVVRQRDPRKGVPFFLTYHPLFKSMGKIINKNLNLLYMDNKVEKVFSPKPMVSSHSARKWAVIWLELNYIQKQELKFPLGVVVSAVRFV